ncbi:hypothetical protein, partial [Methylobrevis pamukkalensis]|uniref:hypothetical protein n=1 Tax=Methylobrevis pamukkalensis TaxID=1439726 RepID=UPI000A667B47
MKKLALGLVLTLAAPVAPLFDDPARIAGSGISGLWAGAAFADDDDDDDDGGGSRGGGSRGGGGLRGGSGDDDDD